MGRRAKHESRSSLRTLILFCVVVFFVIAVSLTYKAVSLFKTSTFDGDHLFVVAFIQDKKIDVVGFDPQEKKLTHLSVKGIGDPKKAKEELGILFDGTVTLKRTFTKVEDAAGFLQDAATIRRGATSDLSIVDLLRLSLFARAFPANNIESEEIHLPRGGVRIDETVRSLFTDQTLIKENSTVEVVNGTGVSGLGQYIERLLLNRGATIIAVTNADTKQRASRIEYSGDTSYTLKKVSTILQVQPVFLARKGIADIILVIGSDRIDQF